jgi:hypothetical protein
MLYPERKRMTSKVVTTKVVIFDFLFAVIFVGPKHNHKWMAAHGGSVFEVEGMSPVVFQFTAY